MKSFMKKNFEKKKIKDTYTFLSCMLKLLGIQVWV